MTARDLPPVASFAEDVVNTLGGGEVHALGAGDCSALALALAPAGGAHLVLVRDHGHSITLSLPDGPSWALRTRAEWREAEPHVKEALDAQSARAAPAVTLADAVVELAPVLEGVTHARWRARVSGVPVPREMWLEDRQGRVGLFQEGRAVVVVVWIGSEMHAMAASVRAELAIVAPWLSQTVGLQLEAARQAGPAGEAAQPAASGAGAGALPRIADVLSALRAGTRVAVLAGRAGKTYFMDGERLRCELTEEADAWVVDATEDELAKDIERYPDKFRGL
jgi:hypothetical protein